MWSTHLRRIAINRSANEFCHGEPGAMGLSRMPMARSGSTGEELDPAALPLGGGAVPPDDERVLRFGEVGDLVERLEIMRAALVAFLLVFVLAAAEFQRAPAREAPNIGLNVVARPRAQDLRGAIDQRADIAIDPPQDQRAFVRGKGQAEQQIRFAPAGLAAIEQFIREAAVGLALRSHICHPHRVTEDGIGLREESRFELRLQGTEADEQFIELHRMYST